MIKINNLRDFSYNNTKPYTIENLNLNIEKRQLCFNNWVKMAVARLL